MIIMGENMKKLAVLLAVIVMFCLPGMASAYLFNFDYSGTGVTASGTFTADSISSGVYLITGISGVRNNQNITSFVTGGSTPFQYKDTLIDNVLIMPNNPAFLSNTNSSGFDFGTISGDEFNPYYSGGKYYEWKIDGGPSIELTTFNVTASSVPIPPTVYLLGAGLLGLVGLRRKFRK
jgi:hypothetical protein